MLQTHNGTSKKFFVKGLVSGLNHDPRPLTLDEMRRAAPSVFAETKYEDRSERYTYIPTSRVVEALMGEGFQPVAVKQGGSRIEGKVAFTKHMIRFRHSTHDMRARNGSVPEVILINAHDGTASYRVYAGILEMLCLNGLVAANDATEFRCGHTGNIIDKVRDGTWQVVGKINQVIEEADYWRGIELTPAERVAFAEAAVELRFDEGHKALNHLNPSKLLTARRDEEIGQRDLYRTFNVVQENVIRGGEDLTYDFTQRTERDGRVFTRQRQSFVRPVNAVETETNLNRALWTLTRKMAELKAS